MKKKRASFMIMVTQDLLRAGEPREGLLGRLRVRLVEAGRLAQSAALTFFLHHRVSAGPAVMVRGYHDSESCPEPLRVHCLPPQRNSTPTRAPALP